IELLLAVLLASFVMYALVRFVDVTLTMWSRAEDARSRYGRVQAILDRMATDLVTTHPGHTGDLVVEWVPFDLGGDSAMERAYPRLRLVRRPSQQDWLRLGVQELTPEQRQQWSEGGFGTGSASGIEAKDLPEPLRDPVPGLAEVLWVLLPTERTDLEATGRLYRAEQREHSGATASFFRPDFARGGAYLESEPLEAIGDGILWWELELSSEETDLDPSVGSGPGQARLAWDARGLDRPDREAVQQNATAVVPSGRKGYPVLPTRVRLVLELELPADLERRPTLVDPLDREQREILVSRGERLNVEPGAYLRVGAEWMRVLQRNGDRVAVERGQRGTLPGLHKSGTVVHFGFRGERLVTLPTARSAPRSLEEAP
ncbi:MAG TPA: hypothetical protein PLJ12_11405, partial [Planctomycetota bacterium]|nr:hypothetical protein [Planctomycetota bacterium]